ncbi:MAG: TonB-dependent receptor [Steroidobacteraceae bacterium]
MFRSARVVSPLLLALTSTFVVGRAAQADDAATQVQTQTAATLQEVVVTAQKRQETLHNVPMGVTAITSADIQSMHLIDFADLETQVPGLSVELVAPGLDRLTIRGENVGGVGSTVTTYIDDVPFGSSNALANGEGTTGDFDTWDLERVEVLRGPQGTLYGAGSEGGLLKYVTNPPDPTKFAAAFELGDEDVAHGDDAPSYKAMLNLPVGGSAAFRLDGFYTRMPGYVDDPQLGESDVNRGYNEGGRASFLVNVTDNFSIRLTAFGQTMHTDGSPEIDVFGGAGTPLTPPADELQPDDGNYNQHRFINEPSTFKYDIYSGTLDWNLGWGTLTSVTSYGKTTQDQFTDATSTAAAPGLSFGVLTDSLLPPGTNAGVAETSDLVIDKLTQEVRLASSTGQPLEWQAGAFFTRESSTLPQTLPSFIIPTLAPTGLPSLENANLDALYREWSAFAQIDYHFIPAFDVALGGRWSENKQSENEVLGGLLVSPTQTTGGASTGTDFTYSVAPRWHVSQDTMAYVRVASGYRPGGPNALPPITPTGVGRTYQADSTVNYEIGVKSNLLDNRLSVDVDAFQINWKKIQLFEFVDDFGINANGGTATSKGLEWTLGLTPVNGLTFTLAGAYVNAYLTEDAPAAGGANGDQLPYAPKWSNSLDANYTWRAFADYSAFAGATWSYIGSRASDFSTTEAVAGGAVVFEANPRPDLGGYNTLNLRAGIDNGRWTFELYCKNIADTRGLTFYTNTGTPNFGGAIGIQEPRTIGATIDLHL